MTRTTSIATMPMGWRIGRALTRPQRFSDLMAIISHTAALTLVLKKLVNDGLARKRNDCLYELTSAGQVWIECATPLLQWVDAHPRNKPVPQPVHDPVSGWRSDITSGDMTKCLD
jgi:DNA-binding HxlR family transcriptional regulator